MKRHNQLYHHFGKFIFLIMIGITMSLWFGYLYHNTQASSALQASSGLVQGRAILQGSSNSGGVLVTFTDTQVETTPDGNFVIAVNSPFVLNLTAQGYLDARVEGVLLTDALVLDPITLLAGDLNGDDRVDIFDLAIAGTSFGSNNFLADINRDGVVNILDLALVGANYGTQGPTIIIVNSPAPTATATTTATTAPTATATPSPTSTPSPTPTATTAPSISVTGSVLGPGGETVANALVTIQGEGIDLTVTSDSSGAWTASLPLGVYEFEASASGYGTWPSPRQVDIGVETEIVLTLAPLTNAVAEGDFEGSSVWQVWDEFDGEIPLTGDAFDGDSAALLGTGNGQVVTCWQNNQPGELWTLKQTVTIPNITQPGLSFVYKINTTQSSFDYAWAEVVLIVDGNPQYLIPWGQVWETTDDWEVVALDLSQWRGQTVDLRFQVVHCSNEELTATIDRVSIGAVSTLTSPPAPPPADVDFAGTARRMTACENNGKHHLFVTVEDQAGNGLADVNLRVFWPDGEAIIKTGLKPEFGPGYVDFPMFKGTYWIEVLDSSSEVVGPLTVDIFVDEPCADNGNPVGNSAYHYSYEVTFTKVR